MLIVLEGDNDNYGLLFKIKIYMHKSFTIILNLYLFSRGNLRFFYFYERSRKK